MDLDAAALDYHRADPPGKLAIEPTKPLATQRDLALAYSPGVAAACTAIQKNRDCDLEYTGRGNLVAVISNGTATLGLGDIGALACKPVMEGKAVLFKKFAGINVFDIEIDETEPEAFIETVARLEPTFGGINLEDIKAPECFIIESTLRERMAIPVFHDDQHGTAIVAAAAIINGMRIVEKKLADIKVVACGAGAAALACLNLLVELGVPLEHITVCDIKGVVYTGRTELMDEYKARYASDTKDRTLGEAVKDADVFLGLSAGGVLKPEMVESMARDPLILAMANPHPEIDPEEARRVRPDSIVCTGRSDYPNQVNNVICFPFIFRGALDVGATAINEEMKKACVYAIADLARAEVSDVVARAYGGQPLRFGRDYLLPKPFDPRLIIEIAPRVAEAAIKTGVARRPIEDFEAYRGRLTRFVFRSGNLMKPVFEEARGSNSRLLFGDGEEERVLHAAQQILSEGIARPLLLGRRERIEQRVRELSLSFSIGRHEEGADVEIVDPEEVCDRGSYGEDYYAMVWRLGTSIAEAHHQVRTLPTILGAMMLRRGEIDALICGPSGRFGGHLAAIRRTIGLAKGVKDYSTLNVLILSPGTYFVCDTYVTPDPSAEEIAEVTFLAASYVRRFGIQPRVALLSHSNFGSHSTPSARKMQIAAQLIRAEDPDLPVDGEMHGDAALSEALRNREFPHNRLVGEANVWIMPNLDAANISYNLIKQLSGGVSVGPILLGAARPVHIATTSISVRGLLNLAAVAVVGAGEAWS